MCTNLYHQDAFLYLPEELPCASAATVISAISGSARCHRVHLTEPLVFFIFHKELKPAISSSAKRGMKMGHSGVCGASYIVEVLNIVCANSQQHAHTTRMCEERIWYTHWYLQALCSTLLVYKLHSNVMEHAIYISYGMLEHALLALSMYVYRHDITVYAAWNRSIY